MPQAGPSDLRVHPRGLCLCSLIPVSQIFADLQLRMEFSSNCDSRVDCGGPRNPLDFARAAELEPYPAAANHADDVRHGALQPCTIPIRVAGLLLLCRSAGDSLCHGLVRVGGSSAAIRFRCPDRLLSAICCPVGDSEFRLLDGSPTFAKCSFLAINSRASDRP